MPPFQYEAYRNPYVQSMSALLQQPGQIEAQRAQGVANAQAQATQTSGQAYGNAIQGAGQAFAGAIQQATDPRRQLEETQLGDLKRAQAGRQALAQAIKANTDPKTGETNHEAVAQQVGAAGFPDQAESWLKVRASTSEALAKLRDSKRSYEQQQLDTIGDLAFHANSAEDFNSSLGLAATSGLIDEAHAHQFAAQTDATPDGWKGMKARFEQFSPTWKKRQEELNKPVKVGEGEQIVIPGTEGNPQVVAQGAAKPMVVPEGSTVIDPATKAVIYAGSPKALDEFQTFKKDYPATLGKSSWDALTPEERIGALGKYAESKADPAMRAAALAQKNLAEMLARAQINAMPTPEQAKSVADDLVHHRIAPEQLASLFSTRGKEGLAFKLAVTAEAKKQDPEFNFEEASAEYNLAKSAGFQNTVRYMDAAVESIPRLEQTVKKIGNGQFKSINDLVNASKTQFNDSDLKAFKTDALLVGDEIAKILSGGGTGSATSDAKLKQASEIFSASDNVPAIAAAVKEVQFLIGNRRAALTRGTYMEGSAPKGTGSQPPAASSSFHTATVTRRPVK